MGFFDHDVGRKSVFIRFFAIHSQCHCIFVSIVLQHRRRCTEIPRAQTKSRSKQLDWLTMSADDSLSMNQYVILGKLSAVHSGKRVVRIYFWALVWGEKERTNWGWQHQCTRKRIIPTKTIRPMLLLMKQKDACMCPITLTIEFFVSTSIPRMEHSWLVAMEQGQEESKYSILFSAEVSLLCILVNWTGQSALPYWRQVMQSTYPISTTGVFNVGIWARVKVQRLLGVLQACRALLLRH